MRIIEERRWLWSDIRAFCITWHMYTRGTNDEYDNLRSIVVRNNPDKETLYRVALDIKKHSVTDREVTSIMFMLNNEVVHTFYKIEED